MGRRYSVAFSGVTVTSAGGDTDLIEISPAAGKPVRCLGFNLAVSNRKGDAQEENLNIVLARLPATVTGGNGTAITPRRVDGPGQGAASATVEHNAPNIATTTGTVEYLYCDVLNVRAGLAVWLPPEINYEFVNGEMAVLRMTSTASVDMTMSCTLHFEEIG